jgi:hypothetical protein
MRIKVNVSNEYTFTPDIFENMKQAEAERFKIVFKKLNQTLCSDRWISYTLDGSKKEMLINMRDKIRDHFVRIINPPTIQVDGKTEHEMTLDDILSEKYPELSELVSQIISFIGTLSESGFERKKS